MSATSYGFENLKNNAICADPALLPGRGLVSRAKSFVGFS